MSHSISVYLRPYALADAPAVHAAAIESVAEMNRWMPWCHAGYSIGDSLRWLVGQENQRKANEAFEFAIFNTAGAYLGGCGINQIHQEYRSANLAYWVRSSATGQGVAPQAVTQLVDWTYAHTNLDRLKILCVTENIRSQRVAEKVGATREGVLRHRLVLNGKTHDAIAYSLSRDDWAARSGVRFC